MAVEPYEILIPGHYFCDIIFSGIPGLPEPGKELFTEGLTVVPGGIMNTVSGLKRLGVRVGWLSTLGSDFFSQYVAETAQTEAVDLSLMKFIDQPLKRVTVALSYTSDRAFVTYVDKAPDLIPRIYEALEGGLFKHLHFTGLQVDERIPELIRSCHAQDITVSMDCQHREQTIDMPLVKAIVSSLDMFMPNAVEAKRLTQTGTLEEAAAVLSALTPYLIIKDGENGAHAWSKGDYSHAPAIQAVPVDTTGAGDIFNAGFLAAHFQEKSTGDCLRWGNIAGGLSLRGYGGYSTAPTLDELTSYL